MGCVPIGDLEKYYIRKMTMGGGWVWTHTSWERACNYGECAIPLRFAFQARSLVSHGFWAF